MVSPKITNFMGSRQQVARLSTGTRRVNPSIVRSYDIRGRVGSQLTCDDAYALGLAYASVAGSRGLWRIAVCRDGRVSSQRLEDALIDGLIAGGTSVYPLGLGPTPLLYYAVQAGRLDGGLMVTGSHNPKDENGFKLLLSGNPVFGQELYDLVTSEPVLRGGGGSCRLTLGPDNPGRVLRRNSLPAARHPMPAG